MARGIDFYEAVEILKEYIRKVLNKRPSGIYVRKSEDAYLFYGDDPRKGVGHIGIYVSTKKIKNAKQAVVKAAEELVGSRKKREKLTIEGEKLSGESIIFKRGLGGFLAGKMAKQYLNKRELEDDPGMYGENFKLIKKLNDAKSHDQIVSFFINMTWDLEAFSRFIKRQKEINNEAKVDLIDIAITRDHEWST